MDGHEPAHKQKFGLNVGWFGIQELMFGEDAIPEYLPNFVQFHLADHSCLVSPLAQLSQVPSCSPLSGLCKGV